MRATAAAAAIKDFIDLLPRGLGAVVGFDRLPFAIKFPTSKLIAQFMSQALTNPKGKHGFFPVFLLCAATRKSPQAQWLAGF
tara:strand:- start:677 stop:922 length:246 start_codon:yes stop_codon:yes gene_type:complete